jgi:PEP-CTERM motif
VIFAPRKVSVPAVALAATLLLGPLGAAPARPAPSTKPGTHPSRVAPMVGAPEGVGSGAPRDAPEMKLVKIALLQRLGDFGLAQAEEVVRSLCVLAMTMSLSPVDIWYVKPQDVPPQNLPPDNPPPEVLPPPPEQPPPPELPPPPPPPIRVPEPATVTSALIGSTLAAFAWWRRRRRPVAIVEETADDSAAE